MAQQPPTPQGAEGTSKKSVTLKAQRQELSRFTLADLVIFPDGRDEITRETLADEGLDGDEPLDVTHWCLNAECRHPSHREPAESEQKGGVA